MRSRAHKLRIDHDAAAQTTAVCSCGEWSRGASLETVAVTGRPREDALRTAHAQHVREATTPPTTPRGPR